MADDAALYLTTPIYYVNDVPHVGHAYTTIAADAVTRARRLRGGRRSCSPAPTSTARTSSASPRERGMTPAGALRRDRRPLPRRSGSGTTSATTASSAPPTTSTSGACWPSGSACGRPRRPTASRAVYRGKYAGWYCPRCEAFKTEDELKQPGNVCPDHERPCEWTEEENFFFRLSAYLGLARETRSGPAACASIPRAGATRSWR